MNAVVFHETDDVRLDSVAEPTIKDATDAIVEITNTAICAFDRQLIGGAIPGMKPGTILGHEGVGTVMEVGPNAHNLRDGDRVVISPTIACGNCSYCRESYFAQCDHANPRGRHGGTAMFGGPKSSGGFDGLQTEFARIPFANVGLVKLPDQVTDDQAILIADVFATGYFAAELAEIKQGDVVAVFGCGSVGQFAIKSAFLRGAARVLAIDSVESRLETARSQGAEVINFDQTNPVHAVLELTQGIGPSRVIDAVGIQAHSPLTIPPMLDVDDESARIERQRSQIAPLPWAARTATISANAPMQALGWAIECIAKAGILAIVGSYPHHFETFPLGRTFERNITVKMGICHHRRYIPQLLQMVAAGVVDPTQIVPPPASLLADLMDRRRLGFGGSDQMQLAEIGSAER